MLEVGEGAVSDIAAHVQNKSCPYCIRPKTII